MGQCADSQVTCISSTVSLVHIRSQVLVHSLVQKGFHIGVAQDEVLELGSAMDPSGASQPIRTCPELTAVYIPAILVACFFRTYSARIYFIGTNSSLACLHMPHPSHPVDDATAHSYNREHGRLARSRGRLDRASRSPQGGWDREPASWALV